MMLIVLFLINLLISDAFLSTSLHKLKRTLSVNAASETESAINTSPSEYSFIKDELRAYAMKLHTKDQAPREGQMPAKKPVSNWSPGLINYVEFLVDSLTVYETMEEIVNKYDELSIYRNTGLERVQALREDLVWIQEYDSSIVIPECGSKGKEYSAYLKSLVEESIPKFMCHFYNHYFAHTAGGLMIGKRMSKMLLENQTLKFYQWDGDVRAMIKSTQSDIDSMASSWNDDEKQACLEETMSCFKFGGALNSYLKDPAMRG